MKKLNGNPIKLIIFVTLLLVTLIISCSKDKNTKEFNVYKQQTDNEILPTTPVAKNKSTIGCTTIDGKPGQACININGNSCKKVTSCTWIGPMPAIGESQIPTPAEMYAAALNHATLWAELDIIDQEDIPSYTQEVNSQLTSFYNQ